jgi:hypothetical protein
MFSEFSQPLKVSLVRIRAEYWEMPGLKLTPAQAQRLWGLDRESCNALLDELLISGFLARTSDGAFVRRDRSSAS